MPPPRANGSQPRQSTCVPPGATPPDAAADAAATTTAATATPGTARPSRPERSTTNAQRTLPSASIPRRNAYASSRSVAGNPTPTATAATRIVGRRATTPRTAARASAKPVHATSPWSGGKASGSKGARTAGASWSAPQACSRARCGQVSNASSERRERGTDADHEPAPVTERKRRHERQKRQREERAPGGRPFEQRPGQQDGPDRRRSGRERTEASGASQRHAPRARPGRPRAAPRAGGRRAGRPRPRDADSVVVEAVGGRPAYVGASTATSAGIRPPAARATRASATCSGRAVTTTSSATVARTPRGATSDARGVPSAPSTPASASSARSHSAPSVRTRWMSGAGVPITRTAPRARAACARTRPAAALTASSRLESPGGPAIVARSTSRRTATLSRGASSSSRTISRPRRADVAQWTARRGSPSTYSRTPCGSSPLGRRTGWRRPPSPRLPASLKRSPSSGTRGRTSTAPAAGIGSSRRLSPSGSSTSSLPGPNA